MKKTFVPILLLVSALTVTAQERISPLMRNKMCTTQETRSMQNNDIYAFVALEAGDKDLIESVKSQLKSLGVQINTDLGDLMTVVLPSNLIEEVANIRGIKYIDAAQKFSPQVDVSRKYCDMNTVQSMDFNKREELGGYTGRGVVVGVVDYGFNYIHPAFYNDDRTEFRIRRVWEQRTENMPAYGSKPANFSYGTEFLTTDKIQLSAADTRDGTHGTHVTNIAAGGDRGSENGAKYHGMAPESDIVMVSYRQLDANNVNIADGVKYIFDYADSQGQPAVVNLSLGIGTGPHDGTSLFDQMCDRMASEDNPGHIIVGSSGNFDKNNFHINKTFSNEDVNNKVELKSVVNFPNGWVQGDLDVWAEIGAEYELCVAAVNGTTGEIMETTPCIGTIGDDALKVVNYTFKNAPRYVNGRIRIACEENPYNNKKHAAVSFECQNISSGYELAIILTPLKEGTINIWSDGSLVTFKSAKQQPAGYAAADGKCTILEIGGVAKQIISVGAYSAKSEYYDAISKRAFPTGYTLNELASFSSRGMTIDGRIKPDITAPGVCVTSAINSYYNQMATYYTPFSCTGEKIGSTTYNYGIMSGTSQASPTVAGILATWLEADPTLTAEKIRDIFAKTALTDEYTGQTPNQLWGYGKIDGLGGICEILGIQKEDFEGISPIVTECTDQGRYDFTGRRIRVTRPGQLYIQGGKKMIHSKKY